MISPGGNQIGFTVEYQYRHMVKFRFQDLKIWQLAIEIADELFEVADKLDAKRLYRFAEQLRGAAMSMSNNTCPVK